MTSTVPGDVPAHKQLIKKFPNGISVTTIIAETVPLSMPADARNLSTQITKEHEPYYCCVSEVVPGTGFRAATVRSITAGIRIIARSKFPAKVFADVTSAASWHAPLMAPHVPSKAIDPGDFSQAAERVRVGPS